MTPFIELAGYVRLRERHQELPAAGDVLPIYPADAVRNGDMIQLTLSVRAPLDTPGIPLSSVDVAAFQRQTYAVDGALFDSVTQGPLKALR